MQMNMQDTANNPKNKTAVLVVDDDDITRIVCSRAISKMGYQVIQASSGNSALQKLEHFADVNLVILDINMPEMDGIETLRQIKQNKNACQVIMITASNELEHARKALRLGAYDYLVKPLEIHDLQNAVERGLEKVRLENKIKQHQAHLEDELARKTKEVIESERQIQKMLFSIVLALADAMEFRDKGTGDHARRIAEHSAAVAKAMGMPEEEVRQVFLAGVLHDIGKLGIPDSILQKPGPLSEKERNIIKTHAEIGANIIKNIYSLEKVAQIVKAHHERYDGKGYPQGLAKEQIPLGARIIAVADTYDAMVTARPYQSSKSLKKAVQEIENMAGTQFDPQVVKQYVNFIINQENHRSREQKKISENLHGTIKNLVLQNQPVLNQEC